MNNQNKGEAMEAKVIKTWAERIAHHPDRDAAEHIDEAKDAEIADLRAALASAQEEIAELVTCLCNMADWSSQLPDSILDEDGARETYVKDWAATKEILDLVARRKAANKNTAGQEGA